MNVKVKFENCLEALTKSSSSCASLRRLILLYGVPEDEAASKENSFPKKALRAQIWKILLGVKNVSAERYLKLVKLGEHPRYGKKINNDTFRTFRGNKPFSAKVPEKKIIRVLNAFVSAQETFPYVQGMNALCGPFLYTMPEVDAFYCFEALVVKFMPNYITTNLEGVHKGCKLVSDCLSFFDPELMNHLEEALDFSCEESRKVFTFAPILTLGACYHPLDSVIKLWDIYFATGIHMNIMMVVSQLLLRRKEIIKSSQESLPQYLTGRQFPSLQVDALTGLACTLILHMPISLYFELENHPIRRMGH